MNGNAGLSAGAVAHRLGVAVTTLRTWHQRYGLGPSLHEPGQHRRYGPADLARLDVMRRLTAQGVPAAEAARIALARAGTGTGSPGRAGGGHAIPVGRAGPAARGLASAAMRLDAPTMRAAMQRSVSERGVVSTWDEMLRPVLTGIGLRHAATHKLIEVEHLLSRTISEVLGAVPRPPPGPPPRVLLACAEDEQHSLPLEALSAALAERGIGCRSLGARVPSAALAAAVRRTGPAAVVIWSHAPGTANPVQLRAIVDGRPRPAIIAAAGPGWTAAGPGISAPETLAEALHLVESVAPAPH